MQDLIKIENKIIGDEFIKAVNARELYQYLESKQDFSTWIKRRIEQYDFMENKDYMTLHQKVERTTQIEYYISLNMAKELSMVEKNDKGKLARKYFILCEEQLKALKENNYPNYLRMLADEMEAKQNALLEIERLKPFEEIVDNSKVIFSKKESVYDKEKGFKKDVQEVYPFLSIDKITLILDYYTKTRFEDTNHYVREEVLEIIEDFFNEADVRLSNSKKVLIMKHPCLLNQILKVKKDKAIQYLDYSEEDFT